MSFQNVGVCNFGTLFRNWKFLSEFFDKCSDIQMEGRKDFSLSQCDFILD